jgi:transposase
VLHNFNADGFKSLHPKYKGGRPRTFTLPERREIEKIAESKPTGHVLSFSAWSLAKLADRLVPEGGRLHQPRGPSPSLSTPEDLEDLP